MIRAFVLGGDGAREHEGNEAMTNLADIIWPEKPLTSAVPYSQMAALEKGKPILHNSQVQLVLDRMQRDYVCGKRLCGGMLGQQVVMVDGHTCAYLHCMVDPKHRGIRKPRMTQKPYGLPGNRKG